MSILKSNQGKAGRLIDGVRSPSPVPSSSQTSSPHPPSRSPIAPAALLEPTSRLAIIHNNSNVNRNAPGGTIINNNSVVQVFTHEQIDADLDTIEKGLGKHHVSRAAYDAQPSNGGCMEGTRVQLLESTQRLVTSRGGAHIVWIAGMAGTGKTSIALTICKRLVTNLLVLLGGTFFCSRAAGIMDQADARHIIPTLVILLARQVPTYARALAAELKQDPDLASKGIGVQVERLLVKPLQSVGQLDRQIVFVIDALDECSDQDQLAELINALADFISPVPVKFLFTSRPEMHIRETLISDTSLSSIVQLHMVDETLVTADIRLYIQRTFEEARTTPAWYTDDDIGDLTALSGGLFIYASTALAYILKRRDPPGRSERLKTVKTRTSTSALATGPLDKMYSLVMRQASDPSAYEPTEIDETRRIVAVVLSVRAPLTIKALAEILGLSPEHLRGALDELHAVIFVPEKNEQGELRTLHASFDDFIFTRAPEYIRIGKDIGHYELARACLQRMTADDLCFNISHSRSSYEPNPKTRPDRIARSLSYACLHWAHHMTQASEASSFDDVVESVLRLKFLFWIEVLSVVGEIARAAGLLRTATRAVISPYVSQFLHDAHSFVVSSHEAIACSAPHIYLSALAFAPRNSIVYQAFSPRLSGLPAVDTFGTGRHDGHCTMVLIGHTDEVRTIAHSPNGEVMASGSQDGTVKLWDTVSGEETCAPLMCGGGGIQSIAYTPDGSRLIAGTSRGSVLIWDVMTGQMLRPPRVHLGNVLAVAVSPDGKTIASASADSTIALYHLKSGQPVGHMLRGHRSWVRAVSFSPEGTILASGGSGGVVHLWDYHRGQSLGGPLREDDYEVLSVAFSPDGIFLASGSGSNVIRVWDVRTRQRLHTYVGHQGPVKSVAFAPDGHTLVSASRDSTVRIWNLRHLDRKAASLVLHGHFGSVNAVSISKDGLYIASASSDHNIRVWNANGASSLDMPMDGHTGPVHDVSVSYDGRLIASASADGSARVWDVQTCQQMYPPLLGHDGPVRAVGFSLDDRWIVTGSDDKTLRLWDANTGQFAMAELCGHRDGVTAIAFSPNGLYLASGSYDRTVRIWDVVTGHSAEISLIQSDHRVLSVAYSPGGEFIAVGGYEGGVETFDPTTGRLIHKFSYSRVFTPKSLAFSPDGTQFVRGSHTTVTVFDVQTGQYVADLSDQSVVNTVAYSPDGRFIACGMSDFTSRLWCPSKKNFLESLLSGHAGAVSSVVFSSNGQFLITGSNDTTIRISDLEKTISLSYESDSSPLTTLARAQYENGWLVSASGQLLLWVPPVYRGHLEIGSHSRIMSTHRAVVTANGGTLYQGEEWIRCWGSNNIPVS